MVSHLYVGWKSFNYLFYFSIKFIPMSKVLIYLSSIPFDSLVLRSKLIPFLKFVRSKNMTRPILRFLFKHLPFLKWDLHRLSWLNYRTLLLRLKNRWNLQLSPNEICILLFTFQSPPPSSPHNRHYQSWVVSFSYKQLILNWLFVFFILSDKFVFELVIILVLPDKVFVVQNFD